MINEAARCIDEGVVKNMRQLDLAIILGAGFPAFRGGVLRYADAMGASLIVEMLINLREKISHARFEPAPLLVSIAKSNSKFYQR